MIDIKVLSDRMIFESEYDDEWRISFHILPYEETLTQSIEEVLGCDLVLMFQLGCLSVPLDIIAFALRISLPELLEGIDTDIVGVNYMTDTMSNRLIGSLYCGNKSVKMTMIYSP